ncbi:hypothetical protein NHQ30_007367 [Ciborinia camelliae]|nr:hypothetical protein NHQ30_007367 [Ciborinia camelliae]
MVQQAYTHHQAITIGSGSGIWSRIHIWDLGNLFFSLAHTLYHSPSKETPHGNNGYYFAENSSQSFNDIAERIGKLGARIKGDKAKEVLGWKQKFGENDLWAEVDSLVLEMGKEKRKEA